MVRRNPGVTALRLYTQWNTATYCASTPGSPVAVVMQTGLSRNFGEKAPSLSCRRVPSGSRGFQHPKSQQRESRPTEHLAFDRLDCCDTMPPLSQAVARSGSDIMSQPVTDA